MSVTMDDSIKRWTAKRKTALVIEPLGSRRARCLDIGLVSSKCNCRGQKAVLLFLWDFG
jgi:hypothetical protein